MALSSINPATDGPNKAYEEELLGPAAVKTVYVA